MNIEENKYDLIEDYLMGNLEGSLKADFENLLKQDEELQNLLSEYKLIVEGAKYSGRRDLLNRLKEIERKKQNKGGKNFKIRSLYIGIAAALLLLFTFYFVIERSFQKSPSVLADSYYQPYPAIYGAITRSDESTLTDFERAMHLYESSKYHESIELMNRINDPEKQEIIEFYQANAYLALDEYKTAEELYLEVIQNGELFVEQSRWYLALLYLKNKNPEEAKKLLEGLVEQNSDYSEKSSKLIQSLK